MSDEEEAVLIEWVILHRDVCPEPQAVTWGSFAYIFIPTGVINIAKIQCLICQETKDVTRYMAMRDLKTSIG